ncbi:protein diaphanous homolog 1-like [Chenopodium quinoa]|uniref:protein diaphanous homolog 1-like n=1 Tax=Chenopodium quinoa TaxID=63459 RepID=UPI000B7742E8|nr:protein diaphanous homolog 1-like [Chenopodium quinoa]
MVDNSPQIDINQLLSYCDDLVGVLRDKRDFNLLTQCVQQSKSIQSSSDSDFNTTQIAISDYQDKIDDCKHKIEVARSEVVSNEELERLQKELDEELKREKLLREDLRVIVDKINELDHQRLSLEEQSQRLKKLEDEHEKEQRKLSFYASVTKIIPDLENPSKISGHIIDRDKKAVEKFEFDPLQEDAFDICNKTWKMINL